METWRAVQGLDGFYEVSDQGRVRSVDREFLRIDGRTMRWPGKLLSPRPNAARGGHLYVSLGSRRSNVKVHRLVLETFVGEPPTGKPQALHRNGDPTDNRLENLYWGDTAENRADAMRHGTLTRDVCRAGIHNWENPDNVYWKPTGFRECAGCKRDRRPLAPSTIARLYAGAEVT